MNQPSARVCPVCKLSEIHSTGPILHPEPPLVAGVEIDLGDCSYRLQSCRNCGFMFKDPAIPEDRLLDCYARASSANWELDPDPLYRRFDVLRGTLLKFSPGRRILDVGCFNGALLKFLGPEWDRCGVEPSEEAARMAEERGIRIVGADLEAVRSDEALFDAVVVIDVVEHVPDPILFFRQLTAKLRPGGALVVMTGDTRSPAWLLQGSAYCYCSLPEHVSFYSRASLDRIGTLVGLDGVHYQRLRHQRTTISNWGSDSLKCAIYIIGRSMKGFGIPRLRQMFVERRGPSITSARDHLLYVMRKR